MLFKPHKSHWIQIFQCPCKISKLLNKEIIMYDSSAMIVLKAQKKKKSSTFIAST